MSAMAEGVDNILESAFEKLSVLADAQYTTVEDEDFQFYVRRTFGDEFNDKLIEWAK